jgi:hypothetical protein
MPILSVNMLILVIVFSSINAGNFFSVAITTPLRAKTSIR